MKIIIENPETEPAPEEKPAPEKEKPFWNLYVYNPDKDPFKLPPKTKSAEKPKNPDTPVKKTPPKLPPKPMLSYNPVLQNVASKN